MLKLIELFSGVGAQAKALENLGIEFESHRTCEWEVNAIKSYKEIHFPDTGLVDTLEYNKEFLVNALFEMGISSDGKKPMTREQIARKGEPWLKEVYKDIIITNNLVDITKVHAEDLDIDYNDTYLVTYSFPCQDLSLAGTQKGMEKGSGTRSGLLWEVERILQECDIKPKFLLMENVPQVHSKKHIDDFEKWLKSLEDMGYSNYYQDLNAKNYGIPQNRNRCFMLSVLDDTTPFIFPEEKKLTLRLKDLLEINVDEKYYLNKEQVDRIHTTTYTTGQRRIQEKDWCDTLCARDYKDPKCVEVMGNYSPSGHNASRIVNPEGLAPTVMENHGTVTATVEPRVEQVGNIVHTGNWDNPQRGRIYSPDGLSPSLNTVGGGGLEPKIVESDMIHVGDIPKEILNDNERQRRVYSDEGVSPSLLGRNDSPKILIPENTKKGYKEAYEGDGVYINRPHQKRGCVQEDMTPTLKCTCGNDIGVVVKTPSVEDLLEGTNYARNFGSKGKIQEEDGVCDTLQAAMGCGGGNIPITHKNLRIRKLTPKECWRLMGFSDDDFEKAERVNSNSQLYKQAGNSIVVNVLEAIFSKMVETYPECFEEKFMWDEEL